jgi:hypothetical protein
MVTLPTFKSIHTSQAYDRFLTPLYGRVKARAEEIVIPPIQTIAVTGNQPPATKQYQEAIGVLYGIGYTLKMGLKFGKLPRPAGYFDYKVGALETFWWSARGTFDITNARTLRWQAYLMVPAFVAKALFEAARAQATAKHPEVPYARATLVRINEGHAVQILHIGPYDAERPTIDTLHAYATANGLAATGKHHEVYLSDPRRTPPARLRTVIRFGVRRRARSATRRTARAGGRA